jgi:flagellar biosynthesis protein FlhA
MPNFVFLLLAGALAAMAWEIDQRRRPTAKTDPVAAAPAAAQEAQEASWADVAPLDVLGLEVGYRLIPLVDKAQDGELLRRIRGIRKKFAQEVGFLVSPVHIRDNLELKPNAYKILLKGVEIGEGEAFPGNLLAINPGRVAGQVPARRPRIRPSGCRRCGSTRPCASRRRPTATRWSMPAR